ncbi:MAG TPA: hypothetical protein VFH75_08420 [Actinomycetota bacterium]|nr:hypothetical protein [Actinomycetota bacterium]
MIRKLTDKPPLARTERLIIEDIGAETVVFDEDTGQAHQLSPIASIVFARSDGGNSVTQLAELASSALGEVVDERHVRVALAHLDEQGLMASSPRTISRRTMLRRTGAAAGVAFATPVITSIMTPAFAQDSPPADCPAESPCASQSQGDDFCHCTNTCPGCPDPTNSDCKCPGDPTRLWIDSCECLDCSELTNIGRAEKCAQITNEQCPPDSSPTNPGPGGCHDPNKFLDGICFKRAGDSSEPCPDPSQFVRIPV